MVLCSLFLPGLVLVVSTYVFFNGRPSMLFAGLGLIWVAVIATVAIAVVGLTKGRDGGAG